MSVKVELGDRTARHGASLDVEPTHVWLEVDGGSLCVDARDVDAVIGALMASKSDLVRKLERVRSIEQMRLERVRGRQ